MIWRAFTAEFVGRRRDGALIVQLTGKAAATVGTRFRLPSWDLAGAVDAAEHELSPHGGERTRIALAASYTTPSLFIPRMPLVVELELPAIAAAPIAHATYRPTNTSSGGMELSTTRVAELRTLGIRPGSEIVVRGGGVTRTTRVTSTDAYGLQVPRLEGIEPWTTVEIFAPQGTR